MSNNYNICIIYLLYFIINILQLNKTKNTCYTIRNTNANIKLLNI